MSTRTTAPALALVLALGACGGGPGTPPVADQAEVMDPGPAAVIEQARTVADDLEQRTQEIDSQMRDPFARP